MAFHEVRFPEAIGRGARGGPERRTQVVELASGDEERNASWANSRRRYDVSYGIRRADDLAAVVAFFEARNGRLHGFRFRDWSDYRSGPPRAPRLIASGNRTSWKAMMCDPQRPRRPSETARAMSAATCVRDWRKLSASRVMIVTLTTGAVPASPRP